MLEQLLTNYDYINFIGVDGSGKDTAFAKFSALYPNALLTREPGGVDSAEIIRDVILNISYTEAQRSTIINGLLKSDNLNSYTIDLLTKARNIIEKDTINGEAEAYLYAASRSESIEKQIIPALEDGRTVLGRRSVACSVAYQGYARGLGVKTVWDINRPIVEKALPSLEIFFDLPVEVAMERLAKRTEKQDRLDAESIEFHHKTREGYLNYYKHICPYPYVIMDATGSVEEVFQNVLSTIQHYKNQN